MIVLGSLGFARDFAVSHGGKLFGKAVLFVAGVKMEIRNENTSPIPPCVYTINHCSTLDLFIIISLGLKQIRFVGKKELQYNPFFFIMGNLTGQIFIDRGKSEKAIRRLRNTYSFIKRKQLSIMVAPEGTRTKVGIGPFKKGGIHTAINLEYPIVPIYIEGAGDLARGSEIMNKPGKVIIHIKPPINTSSWSLERVDEHTNDLRNYYLRLAELHENKNL